MSKINSDDVMPSNTNQGDEIDAILGTLEGKVLSDYRDAMSGRPGARTFGVDDNPRAEAKAKLAEMLLAARKLAYLEGRYDEACMQEGRQIDRVQALKAELESQKTDGKQL